MSSTFSFANRYVSNTKDAILHWKDAQNITLVKSDAVAGRVYTGHTVQCTSPLYNIAYGQLGQTGPYYQARNWDVYSSKYQRCRVRKVEVSCEFYIEQEFFYENEQKVGSFVSNSDYYIVGMFLTQNPVNVPPIASPFDWERLQRTGNCVYRRYVKNVSGPLKVSCTVGIAAALQYTDQADVNVRVYPTANIGVNNARIAASYPTLGNLYVTVFVVPQTRTLGANSSG
jgi:hypothetical protein